MSILLDFATIWRYLSSPRCKSDPCCPAVDFINPLFGWKWPTHTKISNPFKKTEAWNPELLLSISLSDELAPRVPGCQVFPGTLQTTRLSASSHEARLLRISLGLTIVSGKGASLLSPSDRRASLSFLDSRNLCTTFIFPFDGPAQADICELTRKRTWKSGSEPHVRVYKQDPFLDVWKI